MDPNHLLIWFVGISTAIWLLTWLRLRRPGTGMSGWLLVSVVVAGVWGTGLILAPHIAGYLAAAVWFPLFLLPLLLLRLQYALLARQRYRAATTVARVMAVLHPADGFRQQPHLYEALANLAEGNVPEARRLLAQLGDAESPLGRLAHAQLLRAENRWEELAGWMEGHPTADQLVRDPNLASWYMRALCELGRYADALRVYQQLPPLIQGPGGAYIRPLMQLFLLAFAGRVQAVERLLSGALGSYSRALGDVWRGTALQAAGQHDAARPLLEALRQHPDALIRATAEQRLTRPLLPLDPETLAEPARRWLDAVERDLEEAATVGSLARPATGRALATAALLLVESAVFLLEIPGGTTNQANLYDLGALIGPDEALDGQYWRLITANFLHYGALHLLLNLFGVWYFGRFLERVIGPVRLILVYLLTGVGSLTAVLIWTSLMHSDPYLLVGASACVMGLLGCSGAAILQRVRVSRSRTARRDLIFLTLILVLQSVFDLATPQVSFAAHAGGALIGFSVGLLLLPRAGHLATPKRAG